MNLFKEYLKRFQAYEILIFLFIFMIFIFGSAVFIDFKSNAKLLGYAYAHQMDLINDLKKEIEKEAVYFQEKALFLFEKLNKNLKINENNLLIFKKNNIIVDNSEQFFDSNYDYLINSNRIFLIRKVFNNIYYFAISKTADYTFVRVKKLGELVKKVIPKNYIFVIRIDGKNFFFNQVLNDFHFKNESSYLIKKENKDYIVNEADLFGLRVAILSDKIQYFRTLNKIEKVSIINVFIGVLFILVLVLIRYYIGRYYYEKERYEQLFEIEHEKFESIVEAIGEGVALIDMNYNIVWANSYLKNMVDLDEGFPCFKTLCGFDNKCDVCKFDDVREKKKICTFRAENFLRGKKGYYDIIQSPLVDNDGNVIAVVELIRDITDIIKLQMQVQESEQYLRNILENIPDAILTFNNQYVVLTANKQAYNLFGNEIAGMNIKSLVGENVIEKLETSGIIENEDLYLDVRGENKPVRISALKITTKEDEHNLMIIRDMSKIRELEAQLIEREKLSALGLLAGGVAHEINNPLVGILNFAQLLDKRLPDGSYEKKLVQTIIEASKDTKNIVSNLLLYARHKEGEFGEFNLKESIEFALKILGSNIKRKNIEVKTEFLCESKIYGNRGKIHQVLINLISNSVDALCDGGEIKIIFQCEGDKKILKIRDNGSGIPDSLLGKIFDPFFTTKDIGKGTGLGLAIVKSIIDEHGWQISVKSEENKFTEFMITMERL